MSDGGVFELADNSDIYSGELSEPHTPPSLTINLIPASRERRNACKLQAVSRRAGPINLAVFKLPELFPSLTGALMQLDFSGANCRSRLLYGGGRKVTFHRGASVWAPFK